MPAGQSWFRGGLTKQHSQSFIFNEARCEKDNVQNVQCVEQEGIAQLRVAEHIFGNPKRPAYQGGSFELCQLLEVLVFPITGSQEKEERFNLRV